MLDDIYEEDFESPWIGMAGMDSVFRSGLRALSEGKYDPVQQVGDLAEAQFSDIQQQALSQAGVPSDTEVGRQAGTPDKTGPSSPMPDDQAAAHKVGNLFVVPTSWEGTHVTDGLGWGTQTAVDIMLPAGTPLGAPEDGTITEWDPAGAQGGGRIYFKGDSGQVYWIGHIDNSMPAGTKIEAGRPFAVVSSDHPRPHVHVDRLQ